MISQRRPDLCPVEHTNVDLVARAAALRRVHPSRLDGDEFRIDPRPSPTSRRVAVEVGGNSRCIRAVPAALAALPVPAVFVGARRVKLGMVLNSCPFLSVRDQSSCGCCLPCSHIAHCRASPESPTFATSTGVPGWRPECSKVAKRGPVGWWAGHHPLSAQLCDWTHLQLLLRSAADKIQHCGLRIPPFFCPRPAPTRPRRVYAFHDAYRARLTLAGPHVPPAWMQITGIPAGSGPRDSTMALFLRTSPNYQCADLHSDFCHAECLAELCHPALT